MYTRPAVSQLDRSPESIFYKANSYYEEGRYEDAIEEYSRLLEQGFESGGLYFNIGNGYFRKGELGLAILHYERAKRLIPRDGDLKSNYRFARSKVRYKVPATLSWYKRVLNRFDMITLNENAILLSCIFISMLLLLSLRMFMIKLDTYFRVISVLLMVVFFLLAFSLYNKIETLNREAVILAEKTDARFEPLESATTHFTLYEGMKVYISDGKKGWIKTMRSDGKTGWVREQDVGKI